MFWIIVTNICEKGAVQHKLLIFYTKTVSFEEYLFIANVTDNQRHWAFQPYKVMHYYNFINI